jgi:hypothetical protein
VESLCGLGLVTAAAAAVLLFPLRVAPVRRGRGKAWGMMFMMMVVMVTMMMIVVVVMMMMIKG